MFRLTAPHKVEAILFDAVGTLIRPDPPVGIAYAQAGRRFGSSRSVASILRRFIRAFAQQEAADLSGSGATSEERERGRWRTIVAEVFDDLDDTELAFNWLWDHFSQPGNWKTFDDVPAVWGILAQRGYRLGIASNFDRRLKRLAGNLEPFQTCGNIFVSSQLGHRKPSSEFFQAVAARLCLAPEQVLLVGDDLENDYRGACSGGWQAVLLDRDRRSFAVDQSRPDYVISSLTELPGRLAG